MSTLKPSKQPRRQGYSIAQKQALRRYHQEHPSLSQKELQAWFFHQFNQVITQPSLSLALSRRYNALDKPNTRHERNSSFLRSREARYPTLEAALFDWITEYQCQGSVSYEILKIKASELWKELDLSTTLNMEIPTFRDGWVRGFLKRYSVKDRKRHGEAAGVDTEAMEEQLIAVRRLVRLYQPEDVYNCDETGLFFKLVPERSLTTCAVAGQRQSKERISLLLASNADGSHKLPLWIVGKRSNPRCFGAARVRISNLNITWKYNAKAWMTTSIFADWLRWFAKEVKGRNILLLMDNFSAHVSAVELLKEEEGFEHINVVYLPPNTTSRCQPLDQGIISSFKTKYRRRWLEFMLEEFNNNRAPLRTMNVLKALIWSVQSWNDVTRTTISNCWRHSTLLAGEPDALMLEPEPEEHQLMEAMAQLVVTHRVQELMSITTFLNPPEEEVLNASPPSEGDKELIQTIASRYKVVQEEEESEEELVEVPLYHYKEALSWIELLRAWRLQQSDSGAGYAFLCALDSEEERIKDEARQNTVQSSLYQYFNVVETTS